MPAEHAVPVHEAWPSAVVKVPDAQAIQLTVPLAAVCWYLPAAHALAHA